MLWRPRCLVPAVLLLSLVLMPAPPAAAALDDASLAAARLAAPRAARVAQDAGYHVCHDIWEALNPLAPCVIDPVRPLADATGNAVKAALHDLVVTTLDGLTDDLRAVFMDWQGLSILSVTPHQVSDAHPDVIALWSLCRAIALALLALLIVGAGLEIMRSKEAGRTYAGPLDALQAIVVCALLANVSLGVSGLLIELSNRICGLVAGGVTLPAIVATPADPLSESIAHALFRLLYIVVPCSTWPSCWPPWASWPTPRRAPAAWASYGPTPPPPWPSSSSSRCWPCASAPPCWATSAPATTWPRRCSWVWPA